MATYAYDTETWLIAPGRLAPRLVCLSWSSGTRTALLDRESGIRWFRERLEAGDTLVGHNVAFDAAVMVQADPELMPLVWQAYDEGRILCTKLADQLRHIAKGWYRIEPRSGKRPGFSLAALSERYLGEELSGKAGPDVWRLRYHELDGVPLDQWPEEATRYARQDAETTYRVWSRLVAEGLAADLVPQARYAWSLHLVSAWGLRTDPVAVAALRERVEGTISAARAQLIEAKLLRENGSKDVAQVRARVVRALGDDAPKTARGAVSTSRDVLLSTGDPDLELLASIGADEKLLSTYVPVLEEGTRAPLMPSYGLAESGRTTCRRPNVQNQPRGGGVRECYVPRDGYVFVGCDYHVAELCSLAQVCLDKFGASRMADVLNQGRDLHVDTAAMLLGISYEQAEERRANGDKAVKQARQLSKALNFGLPGGLGASTFVDFARATYGVELTEARAKELKSQWLAQYPEMARYFDEIGSAGGLQGRFTARQHRSGRLRGGVGFCDGANTYFQGLTADGAKAAVYEAVKATYTLGDPLFGSRVVAFVHDEIILEAPAAQAPQAADRLSQVMVDQMMRYTPDVQSRATPHIMERWYKDAEPAFDQDGVLIPWTPTTP